jgi:hypothetical protein
VPGCRWSGERTRPWSVVEVAGRLKRAVLSAYGSRGWPGTPAGAAPPGSPPWSSSCLGTRRAFPGNADLACDGQCPRGRAAFSMRLRPRSGRWCVAVEDVGSPCKTAIASSQPTSRGSVRGNRSSLSPSLIAAPSPLLPGTRGDQRPADLTPRVDGHPACLDLVLGGPAQESAKNKVLTAESSDVHLYSGSLNFV